MPALDILLILYSIKHIHIRDALLHRRHASVFTVFRGMLRVQYSKNTPNAQRSVSFSYVNLTIVEVSKNKKILLLCIEVAFCTLATLVNTTKLYYASNLRKHNYLKILKMHSIIQNVCYECLNIAKLFLPWLYLNIHSQTCIFPFNQLIGRGRSTVSVTLVIL